MGRTRGVAAVALLIGVASTLGCAGLGHRQGACCPEVVCVENRVEGKTTKTVHGVKEKPLCYPDWCGLFGDRCDSSGSARQVQVLTKQFVEETEVRTEYQAVDPSDCPTPVGDLAVAEYPPDWPLPAPMK